MMKSLLERETRMPSDVMLLAYVRRAVATGAKTIEIPSELLTNASDEAVKETRQYCKLCGVKIVVRG